MGKNSVVAQGAVAAALGLSPVTALSLIPVFSGAYDGMISNSIQNIIDKGQTRNIIRLNVACALKVYELYTR